MQGDRDLSHSLIPAVRKGNLKRVTKLIDYFGLSYSQEWSDGYVLLCHALENKRTEVAKLLITRNSKVNSKNANSSKTPLYFAIRNGDVEIVEMLLDRGASTDVKYYGDTTPLHDAVRNGYANDDADRQLEHPAKVGARRKNDTLVLRSTLTNRGIKIVKTLLNRGANIDAKCNLGNTPLFDAVMKGYVNGVTLLLKYGANVNAQSTCGKTILHFAVESGHLVIVKHILKHCPDVNNKSNRSALNVAVHSYGKVYSKIIEKLLRYGFIVDLEYEDNYKLLHDTIEKGYLKIVEQLLKYATDVNSLNDLTYVNCFSTPLHVAAKMKREQEVKLLISYGANVNAKDITGATSICYAVENNCKEIVEILLEHGADVNISDNYGRTALHFTNIHYSQYTFTVDLDISVKGEIAKLVLSKGANVNAQNADGITTLHTASRGGYTKLVEALLEYNADVNCTDKLFRTPLHRASESGHLEIVMSLLKFGASIDSKDKYGTTALHSASESGHLEIVMSLLKFGASIDSKDKYGTTALYIACGRKNLEIVRSLVKFGASIDSKCTCGRTALHSVSKIGHLEIVKILLKFGASIDSKDDHGKTALHIASEENHLEIVKILLKFGASIDSKDEHGKTALHIASETEHLEIVKILLKFGASIDSKDEHGKTALHIASETEHLEIVKILLNFDASIDSKDECGRTALHIASEMGYLEIVRSLLIFGASIDSKDEHGRTALHIVCKNRYVNNKIAEILKRHMIKEKIANLYASNKDLLAISSDYNLSNFENECEKEVASMKSEKVGNSNTSFYDILTKGISQLAIYAGNKSIVRVFRSCDYEIKFPIYATMIYSHFKKGERRKVLMKQGNEIFDFLFTNFLGIPYICTEKIFTYLSDDDLRTIMVACKPICVSSRNTDNKYRGNDFKHLKYHTLK